MEVSALVISYSISPVLSKIPKFLFFFMKFTNQVNPDRNHYYKGNNLESEKSLQNLKQLKC